MATFTQKELRELVKQNLAIDITEGNEKVTEPYLWTIGISRGKYGINGCLLASHKHLYAITARSSNLFYWI